MARMRVISRDLPRGAAATSIDPRIEAIAKRRTVAAATGLPHCRTDDPARNRENRQTSDHIGTMWGRPFDSRTKFPLPIEK